MLLLAFCCCATQGALAAEPETPPKLRSLLEAALQVDERVLVAQKEIDAAREVINQVDAGKLPQVSLGASSTLRRRNETVDMRHINEGGLNNQVSIRGIYDLDVHERNETRLSIAEATVRSAQSVLDQSRADVMHDTVSAVADVLDLRRRLRIQRSALGEIEQLLEKTELLLEQKAVPRTVLASVERERIQVSVEIINLESSLRISLDLLSDLTGSQVTLDDMPDALELGVFLPATEPEMVRVAMDNSIQIAAATIAVERMLFELDLAETDGLPEFGLEFSHSRTHASDEKEWQVGLALSIDYPVFDGGLKAARLAELRQRLQGARHELERIQRLTKRDAGQVWNSLQGFAKAREVLGETLAIAEKSLIDTERLVQLQQEAAMALIRANQSVADIRLSIAATDHQMALAAERFLYESNSLAKLLD